MFHCRFVFLEHLRTAVWVLLVFGNKAAHKGWAGSSYFYFFGWFFFPDFKTYNMRHFFTAIAVKRRVHRELKPNRIKPNLNRIKLSHFKHLVPEHCYGGWAGGLCHCQDTPPTGQVWQSQSLKRAWKIPSPDHELSHPVMYCQECQNPTWMHWECLTGRVLDLAGDPKLQGNSGQGKEGILKGLRAWFMTENCIGGKTQIFESLENVETFENVWRLWKET